MTDIQQVLCFDECDFSTNSLNRTRNLENCSWLQNQAKEAEVSKATEVSQTVISTIWNHFFKKIFEMQTENQLKFVYVQQYPVYIDMQHFRFKDSEI